jgi:diguanylate cyclase (GGDEF)-like protein
LTGGEPAQEIDADPGAPARLGLRSVEGIVTGVALALGAPLGWLALRALRGHRVRGELRREPGLYLYLTVSSLLAFASFGLLFGRAWERAERRGRHYRDLALTDALTGLRNRRYFQQRLGEEIAASRRHRRPLALAILDIDYFKRVNDSLGHLQGDRVLAALGEGLRASLRGETTAARIGGEELGLLFPDTELEAAVAAAERLRRAAAAAVAATAGLPAGWTITLSGGVTATDGGQPCLPGQLLASADAALYRAKQGGRDRVEASPAKC